MSEAQFQAIGGKRKLAPLTKDLFEEDRIKYEAIKLQIWVRSLKEGERPKKWYKPSKKHTILAFDFMKEQKETDESVIELRDYIDDVNKELGTDFSLK